MQEKKDYNGWKNYETWLLALNIDNNVGLYNFAVDFKGTSRSILLFKGLRGVKNGKSRKD